MSTHAGPNIVEDGLVLSLDPANQKSYSPNVFQFSTDIFSWTTAASRAVLSRDTIASPVGNKPLKMVPSGNDPYTNSYNSAAWNVTPVVNGETWTLSVYVKANRATRVELFLFGANSSGVGFVDGSWIGIASKGFDIGTEWTRISHSITYNNANVAFLHFRLDGTPTLDSGVEIWWDGVQVEKNSTETAFNPNYYGTTINDISNNGNSGILTNSPTFSSLNQGSLVFDGVDDFINCGNNPSINFGTENFTVSAWFKRSSSTVTNARLLAKSASSDTANAASAGFAFFGSNTGMNFAINPTGTRTIILAANYSLNEWVNVVGLIERGVSVRSYRNSSLIATAAAPAGSVSGTTSFLVGTVSAGLNWPGEISNVMLYNKALTENEIKQNFNALRGRYGI